MFGLPKRSPQWFKKNIVQISLYTMGFTIVILVLMFINLWYGCQMLIAYIGIAVASIAAIGSMFANIMTKRALELTQKTTRPFLTLKDAYITNDKLVSLNVKNTGNLPAEKGEFQINSCLSN